MKTITGTIRNGQIVADQPIDWPEGSRVMQGGKRGGVTRNQERNSRKNKQLCRKSHSANPPKKLAE